MTDLEETPERCGGCEDWMCEDCHPECVACKGLGFIGRGGAHCDVCEGMGTMGWTKSQIENEAERRGMAQHTSDMEAGYDVPGVYGYRPKDWP